MKDGTGYEVAIIERNGLPHKIEFHGTNRIVLIDSQAITLSFGEVQTVLIDGEPYGIRFGAPSRELYVGNYPFKGTFGGPPIIANINGRRHEIRLMGPAPEVKVHPEPSYELTRFITELHRKQQSEVQEEQKSKLCNIFEYQ